MLKVDRSEIRQHLKNIFKAVNLDKRNQLIKKLKRVYRDHPENEQRIDYYIRKIQELDKSSM